MKRVLIADDHPLFRQSLRAIIDGQDDLEVVAEAENGIEALKLVKRFHPDIILMDMRMPVMDGIDATRQIKAAFGDVKIIALSSYSEEIYYQKMKEAGACDYLSKVCNREDLLRCIRGVLNAEPADRPNPAES